MTLYGFRHYFASNCLSHGMSITDVAEWMGHENIQITSRTSRHLMRGVRHTGRQVLGPRLGRVDRAVTRSAKWAATRPMLAIC